MYKNQLLVGSKSQTSTDGLGLPGIKNVLSAEVSRIRLGSATQFCTLIGDKCFLFADYLRHSETSWD